MKLDAIKDVIVIVATGGAVLMGVGKFVNQVNDVPKLNRRMNRAEHQIGFVVRGMEKLTKTTYQPPRDEGAPDDR